MSNTHTVSSGRLFGRSLSGRSVPLASSGASSTRWPRLGLALALTLGISATAAATGQQTRVATTPEAGIGSTPQVSTPAAIGPSGPAARRSAAQQEVAGAVAGMGQPIQSDALGRLRGGDSNVTNVTNDIDVDGDVSGNSADNIVSGTNIVSGGAFGNAAGISTVIQNSGSNVLIQNAMIVNVRFTDPAP